MKNISICTVTCLLLTGCWECENCDDGYSCSAIGETEFTFDSSELLPGLYNQEFDPDSIPRAIFELDLYTYFTQRITKAGDESNSFYCSDFIVPDTLIALNFYAKTADTTYNINDALRTNNRSAWLVEDIDLWDLHFWEGTITTLQVVNWSLIPDTTALVSELTFSSGFQYSDETDQLVFK